MARPRKTGSDSWQCRIGLCSATRAASLLGVRRWSRDYFKAYPVVWRLWVPHTYTAWLSDWL
uniref:Uncharacterized protein n=1 Tax=Oryza sativa subsp. japonica TaxID=39947 RepID=Q69XT4_ORYSJ|nr:hypothetical protein [Oryza sativa Japonica Group]